MGSYMDDDDSSDDWDNGYYNDYMYGGYRDDHYW